MFGWERKNGDKEKMSLYKFTHTPLLKNDDQSPNLLKNKNHVPKKQSCLVKKKKSRKEKNKKRKKNWQRAHPQSQLQEIKKLIKKKKSNIQLSRKKKKKKGIGRGYFCPLSSLIFSFQFSLHFGERTFWWT